MKIELSDKLIEKAREHLKGHGYQQPIEVFIEEAVFFRIESYPWFMSDICVHNEECMHSKSVEAWRKEHEPKD